MQLKKKIVIAVDGHSSCGKSTFAKKIAQQLNYIYIDSGAMYRAVAYYTIQHKLVSDTQINIPELIGKLEHIEISFARNNEGVLETFLNSENIENQIRGVQVSQLVSEVSKIKEVRQYLVSLQQAMGDKKGIVMDGRDIGSVVFPDAEIKLFMTASVKVRAQRRYDELKAKGVSVSFEEIEANVIQRDYNDENRTESPLIKAEGAYILDNSNMTVPEQWDWFLVLLKQNNFL